jgi:hypothetical protein
MTARRTIGALLLTAVPWDGAHDKIATAIAGRQTPDVSLIGTTWMGEFAGSGGLDPVPANLLQPGAFFEGPWNTVVVDGTPYGVPWYTETRVLYYRKDLADKAGVQAPTTWDELKTFAKALQDQGGAKHGIYLQPRAGQHLPRPDPAVPGHPLGVFLMRQFMMGLPDELIEAARIDGAGEWRIFSRVIMPLCGPALATLGILTFLSSWNNFLWPLVVAQSEDKYTLPVALALYSVGQNATRYGLLLAGSVVIILPVIALFVALQRYFVQGIATTGIK